jgi:kynurenine formamidase
MNTPAYIDLTHTLSLETPTWDGSCGFELSIKTDYEDCTAPDLFRVQKVTMNAGIGTHMDAPAHCIPNGKTIDALALADLIIDCVVIKTDHVSNEDQCITVDVIEKFESTYGKIQEGTFVLFYTGWDRHWGDKIKYQNNFIFPSVHEETATLLLKRNISGIGIDTLSADTGKNGFPVHNLILGAGKYLVENVANAKDLPETGFKIAILPMKIGEGTEAPIRLVAFV